MRSLRFLLVFLIVGGGFTGLLAAEDAYEESVLAWCSKRLSFLMSETGYLAIVGFAWLESGDNLIGTSPDCVVKLPRGTAPQHAGVFRVSEDGEVEVRFESGVRATIDGQPVSFRTLEYGPAGSDRIQIGRVTFWVLERGGKPSVRIIDPESPFRRNFKGFDNYAVDPAYRVQAVYEPHATPRETIVPNYLKYDDVYTTYGTITFELNGQRHRLTPFQTSAEDTVLFLVFEDETTAKETYGGGRFLYADLRKDRTLELDFNKAYNPPCAFSPYTTCPLPPEGNRLKTAVRAGEKAPSDVY